MTTINSRAKPSSPTPDIMKLGLRIGNALGEFMNCLQHQNTPRPTFGQFYPVFISVLATMKAEGIIDSFNVEDSPWASGSEYLVDLTIGVNRGSLLFPI